MSFWSWLTGHDKETEDAICENDEMVESVLSSLKTLSTNVGTAKDETQAAIESLNSVQGFSEYVVDGGLDVGHFDQLYDSVIGTVDSISSTMTGAVEDIKAFNNAEWYEKILPTIGMAAAKFGEGVVSVGEDLIDGAASIVGFVSGAIPVIGKDVQSAIGDFVKEDWTHDFFDWAVYSQDWAKYSAFTEDSALGAGFEIGGKVVGYLYAGGVLSRLGSSMAANVATKLGSVASKGGIIGSAASGLGTAGSWITGLASSTTWGATAAGFLGGVGNGTETGLQKGLSYNAAFANGLKDGAIQGGLAFAGGKLGEKMSKTAAIKSTKSSITEAFGDGADDFASKVAGSSTDDFVNAAREGADDIVTKAANAVDDAQRTLEGAKAGLKMAEADLEAAGLGATDDLYQAADAAARDVTAAESNLAAAKAAQTAAEAQADTIRTAATKLEGMSSTSIFKAGDYRNEWQGYTDKITQRGEQFGDAQVDIHNAKLDVKAAKADLKTLKSSGTASADDIAAAKDAISDARKGVWQARGAAIKASPLGDAGTAVSKTVGGIKNVITDPGAAAASAANAVKSIPSNLSAAKTAAIETVKDLGVAGVAIGATKQAAYMGGIAYNQSQELTSSEAYVNGLKEGITVPDAPNTKNPKSISYSGDVEGEDASEVPIVQDTTPKTTTPSTNPSTNPAGGQYPSGGGYPSGGSDSGGSSGTPEPTTTPYTVPMTEPVTQPATQPITQPQTQPYTVPQTQPITQPVTQPYTVPQTQPVTVPVIVPPSTEAPTMPVPTADLGGGTTGGDGGTYHSGGSYGDEGFTPGGENVSNELEGAENLLELDETDSDLDNDFDTDSALDNIINSSKYTKVPTSTSTTSKKKGSSSVIPIAAGLSVAAAAGIGAKAYLDRKNNNEFDDEEDEEYEGEYEDDSFESDDWNGNEDPEAGFQPDFSDPSQNDLSDDYYQDNGGSYSAKTSEELADLQ